MHSRLVLFAVFGSLVLIGILVWVNALNTENQQLKTEIAIQKTELGTTTAQLMQANANLLMLNQSYTNAANLLESTQNQLTSTSSTLSTTNASYLMCKTELNKTKVELNRTIGNLNQTKAEFAAMKSEVISIQESINSSIQWFKDNAVLPYSLDDFSRHIQGRCTDNNRLNLACAVYLMQSELGANYTDENVDKLYSIEDFVKRKGGDCEDFSLFMKALLNKLKYVQPNLEVESWSDSYGHYVVYQETSGGMTTEWFINGTSKPLGKLSDLYPYVVCYTVNRTAGHCVVALSQVFVDDVRNVNDLNNASMFEPQSGNYVGSIGSYVSICNKTVEQCDRTPGFVSFVITNNDLYTYTNDSWTSYALFGQKIQNLQKTITAESS